jgi:hypothetical protein
MSGTANTESERPADYDYPQSLDDAHDALEQCDAAILLAYNGTSTRCIRIIAPGEGLARDRVVSWAHHLLDMALEDE